jgi:hypothetical protein
MTNMFIVDKLGQEKYRQQFFKTSMCKYFLENACRKGNLCSHAHSPDELQNKPVLSKTRMCKQILRNGNCIDPECSFAHEIDELVAANAFFRTKMCEFHVSGNGCKLGDKCRYAHSRDELADSDTQSPHVSSKPVSSMLKSIPSVDFNDSPDTGYPMRKRGSVGSRSTMASASYASMGNFQAFQEAAPSSHVPVVFVYPYAQPLYYSPAIHYSADPAQYED